jgi:hypothetical protein
VHNYYLNNKTAILERARKRHDSEKYREYLRNYYIKHKHTIIERSKKRYYQTHNNPIIRARMAQASKRFYGRLRNEILSHYSENSKELKCRRCGFSDIRALTIDHINGGGGIHRQQLKNTHRGIHFYVWLKKNGFPLGFQTLCMNCQFIKRVENNECCGYKSNKIE